MLWQNAAHCNSLDYLLDPLPFCKSGTHFRRACFGSHSSKIPVDAGDRAFKSFAGQSQRPVRVTAVLLPTPMAQDQALRALAEIRSVIDRSARYSRFSALSCFLAGAAALGGSGLCGAIPFAGTQPQQGWNFLAVWAAVLLVAFVSQVLLTILKARQRREAFWTPIARTAFGALLGPGVAGLFSSVVLVQTGHWELLPGVWLLLYGCGLWGVSFFAPLFLRGLGAAFMLAGLLAWAVPSCSALALGLGVGGLHIVFGMGVMMRYRE
jgi:hypothetical protein